MENRLLGYLHSKPCSVVPLLQQLPARGPRWGLSLLRWRRPCGAVGPRARPGWGGTPPAHREDEGGGGLASAPPRGPTGSAPGTDWVETAAGLLTRGQ